MQNTPVCGLCNAFSSLLYNSEIPLPIISKELKSSVKKYLLSKNNYTGDNKIRLGIHKFTYNTKSYIHCPIRKVTYKGKIKFGICKHFMPLEDTLRNRQKLCTHKFRFHYNSNKKKSFRLHLQVSKSIEDVLQHARDQNKLKE